jgi:hypothetical protein
MRPVTLKRNAIVMRNTLLALVSLVAMSAGTGCCCWHHHGCGGEKFCGPCDQGCGYCGDPRTGACGPGGCPGGCAGGECAGGFCGQNCNRCPCSPVPDCYGTHEAVAAQLGGPAGPPTAQVTYPYYTVRGPRDFFAAHPPSIGP